MLVSNFAVLVGVAALASASPSPSLLARSQLERLYSRQDLCTSTCTPFQSIIDSCPTKGCLCTVDAARALQVCVDCAVLTGAGADPDAHTSAQNLVGTFRVTCEGFGLPPVTIPFSAPSATGNAPPQTTISVVPTMSAGTTISQVVVRPSSLPSASVVSADQSDPTPQSGGPRSIVHGGWALVAAAIGGFVAVW